jgi:aryl-alcohol dehydrogenase-like predicted oxidoreductase
MDYRHLGHSGLRVSTLALGTLGYDASGGFAGVGHIDVAAARRQVDMALDAGVNLIDTADAYSDGGAERMVGRVIEGRRERVLLATKARFAVGEGPNDAGLSRHHLIEACEASLQRLGVDHIDLYQLHEWDGLTPPIEVLEALAHLVDSGKVRYVGCSNFTGWQMMKLLGVADQRQLPRFISTQIHYSLVDRGAEHELLPACVDQGLGALIWGPLASGLLGGRYRRGAEVSGPARRKNLTDWDEPPVHDLEHVYKIVDVLVEVASVLNVKPAQVALAWLLTRPGVTSLVVGARTEDQLAANLEAAQLALSAEDVRRLDDVSRTPLPYPLWHQAMWAADRLGPADLVAIAPHLAG